MRTSLDLHDANLIWTGLTILIFHFLTVHFHNKQFSLTAHGASQLLDKNVVLIYFNILFASLHITSQPFRVCVFRMWEAFRVTHAFILDGEKVRIAQLWLTESDAELQINIATDFSSNSKTIALAIHYNGAINLVRLLRRNKQHTLKCSCKVINSCGRAWDRRSETWWLSSSVDQWSFMFHRPSGHASMRKR